MRLKVKDLVLKYISDGDPDLIIEDLDLCCPIAVLGGGGSGKTNLIKVLCGLETIERGEIFFDGIEVGATKPKKRDISLISADTPLFLKKTVRFNLEYPLKKRKTSLDLKGLSQEIIEVLDKKVKDIDEKTRIDLLILRAKLRNSSLILIDEPYSFCSQPDYFVEKAFELLDKTKIALATFDFDLVKDFCQGYIVLKNGKIIFCGDKDALTTTDDKFIKSFLG